jgi:hypothetical protein
LASDTAAHADRMSGALSEWGTAVAKSAEDATAGRVSRDVTVVLTHPQHWPRSRHAQLAPPSHRASATALLECPQ